MSFRSVNQRYLAPAAQSLMIFGIISLCQPWSLFLHKYGVTLTLIGLVAFMVTSKIAPEPAPDEDFHDDPSDEMDRAEAAQDGASRSGGIA